MSTNSNTTNAFRMMQKVRQPEQQPEQPQAVEAQPSVQQPEQTPEPTPQVVQETQQATTELENVNDNNSSPDQGSGNTEIKAVDEGGTQAESASQVEKPWWESESGDTPNEISAEIDYSPLSKALGIEASSTEDFITKVSALQNQNKELSSQVDDYKNNSVFHSSELEQANEIARQGGDYKQFLGLTQNNWDAFDDNTLISEANNLNGIFNNNQEKVQEYLDGLDPVQKQMQANQIREALKAQDEAQKQAIVTKAQERTKAFDEGVRSFLNETENLFGMKLTDSMKKNAHSKVVGENFMNSFLDKSGNPDPAKMVKAQFVLDNISNIVKTAVSQAKNSATESLLNEVTNPQVQKGGQTWSTKLRPKGSGRKLLRQS